MMNGHETWEHNKRLAVLAQRLADPEDLEPSRKRHKSPTPQEYLHMQFGVSRGLCKHAGVHW